jgi:hypothetical protein
MTAFDRGNLDIKDLRPERGYPIEARSNVPAWIAGFVVIAALMGLFAYESGNPLARHAAVQTQDAPPVSVSPMTSAKPTAPAAAPIQHP